jgi:hypothetical protein
MLMTTAIALETSTALAAVVAVYVGNMTQKQDTHSVCGWLHTVCGYDSASSRLIYSSGSDIGFPISVFINLATVSARRF